MLQRGKEEREKKRNGIENGLLLLEGRRSGDQFNSARPEALLFLLVRATRVSSDLMQEHDAYRDCVQSRDSLTRLCK